jgi:hypothetical protein
MDWGIGGHVLHIGIGYEHVEIIAEVGDCFRCVGRLFVQSNDSERFGTNQHRPDGLFIFAVLLVPDRRCR